MSESKQLRYSDLLDEALARIPALAPEWTDHNPADPGIALLELAAWLTETVLYRSTRIDDRSRRALLGLIQGADPPIGLTGAALDAATRTAIKALRRPYRAVTPDDYAARVELDWPGSPDALALGLESQISRLVPMPRCDLEAEDRFARRDAHMSLIVVPDRLCWSFAGTLAIDRPTLFVTQDVAQPMEMAFPAGGVVQITGASANAAIYDGTFAAGEIGRLDFNPADMGRSGEYRITLDQANCVAGLNATGGAVAKRRLTATDGTLLGCRFIPMRRNGPMEIVVTSTSDTLLRLEVRTNGGYAKTTVEGVGVVAASVTGAEVTADQERVDWQCRLFAPEAEPGAGIPVSWHVQRLETARRWDDQGGDRLLDGIWRFLDARRIIGTRHHVVGPRWVPFTIAAEIYLTDATGPDLVRPRLVQALVEYFAPPGHDGGGAREMGHDLHVTEVIAAIEAIDGVDYVDRLALAPEARRLIEDDEVYGLRLDPDEIPVLQIASSDLKLFERS